MDESTGVFVIGEFCVMARGGGGGVAERWGLTGEGEHEFRSASSTDTMLLFILFTVSSHSNLGIESKVMPAPA